MQRRKLIIYVVILILLFVSLGAGTFAILKQNSYKDNNVTIEITNKKAYSRIQAKYYHNGEEKTDLSYDESYEEGYDYSPNGFTTYPEWKIGESAFTVDYNGEGPETLKYEIIVTNLNNEYDLLVSLKDVAVGEKEVGAEKEVYFYTTISYQINSQEPEIKFCNKEDSLVGYNEYNGNQKVSVKDQQLIPKAQSINSTLKIVIEIERKTKVKAFDISNNFKISLDIYENDN